MSDTEVLERLRKLESESNAIRSLLAQRWYTPREVAELATSEGFRKTAETVRTWCRLSQIDFRQAGEKEPIYISRETVELLRDNRWRPLRKPDYNAMPPSRKARSTSLPSQSVAANSSLQSSVV